MVTLLATIIEKLMQKLGDPNLLKKSRFSEEFFTRERKLPFWKLVMYMLNIPNESTQVALNRFTKTLGDDPVSQQAFSKARNKINHLPFLELFKESFAYIPREKRWHGYLLSAIDGSVISLPQSKELLSYFGAAGPASAQSPAARASTRCDVLNEIILDAGIMPYTTGERVAAKQFLQNQNAGDKEINIYDRGYFSWEFVELHIEKGNSFLFRLKSKFNNEIDALPHGDHTVTINGIKLRVLKFALESGELETLVTDVFDGNLKLLDFKKLYALRWGVETKYNIVKNKMGLENFTGLSPNCIRQDFFASMTVANLVAAAKIDADSHIKEERIDKNNKHEYAANVNAIVGTLKDYLIFAFLNSGTDLAASIMKEIQDACVKCVVPIRKGRSFPRKVPRKVKFHKNIKFNA